MSKKEQDMRLSLDTVEATISGGAGELLFTRSAYANACNMQLMQDIISAIDWFNKQENLKVIRVSGAGKAFCAGYDLNEFTNSSPDLIRKSAELGLQMNHALTSVKAITVAAIHGACVGGGMVLAAACDLRYAADDTVFFLPEIDLGVPLAWGGMAALVRELGHHAALTQTLLCEPITPEFLLEKGFLSKVTPAGEVNAAVDELIAKLVQKSGFALRATKQQVLAAKIDHISVHHAFNDANLFYGAILDEESRKLRDGYIAQHKARSQSKPKSS